MSIRIDWFRINTCPNGILSQVQEACDNNEGCRDDRGKTKAAKAIVEICNNHNILVSAERIDITVKCDFDEFPHDFNWVDWANNED